MILLLEKSVAVLALLFVLLHVQRARASRKTLCFQADSSEQSVYNYTLMDIHRTRNVNLSRYNNQVR